MINTNELIEACKKLLKFYGSESSYFEQPTLSGYKPALIMLDQGKLIRSLLKELAEEEDCSDSKGAYP